MHLIIGSKVEIQKLADRLRSENEAFQLKVDIPGFLTINKNYYCC